MLPAQVGRIARAISTVENREHGCEALLAEAYRRARWPAVIGVTGPPGAGKSTLVDALTAHWAGDGQAVAVLAVDPSSPYSGGAVLGDRIRRVRSAAMQNTYFRSLSARGHVGGLSETATDLVVLLGLFGFQRVLIETVGAGQSDVEVGEIADCTVVVAVPGLGDAVQASKAGLMEIGDVFVVNKADLPGAQGVIHDVGHVLSVAYRGDPGINEHGALDPHGAQAASAPGHELPVTPGIAALRKRHGDSAHAESHWVPPVLSVVSTENRGVAALADAVDAFLDWRACTGRSRDRDRERAYAQVVRALRALLLAPYARAPGSHAFPASIAPWIDRIVAGQASPIEAARSIAGDNEHPMPG